MTLKIKVVPEDFIVEELADLPLTHTGEFAVYRLTKRGWNTVDLLHELARAMALPFPLLS